MIGNHATADALLARTHVVQGPDEELVKLRAMSRVNLAMAETSWVDEARAITVMTVHQYLEWDLANGAIPRLRRDSDG